VGGKSVTFNAKGTAPTVFVDAGCVPRVDACFASIIFVSGANSPSPAADGFGDVVAGKKFAEASVLRQTLLSAHGLGHDDIGRHHHRIRHADRRLAQEVQLPVQLRGQDLHGHHHVDRNRELRQPRG
jgi:hypothetical protein